jgi:hypothetical protein
MYASAMRLVVLKFLLSWAVRAPPYLHVALTTLLLCLPPQQIGPRPQIGTTVQSDSRPVSIFTRGDNVTG